MILNLLSKIKIIVGKKKSGALSSIGLITAIPLLAPISLACGIAATLLGVIPVIVNLAREFKQAYNVYTDNTPEIDSLTRIQMMKTPIINSATSTLVLVGSACIIAGLSCSLAGLFIPGAIPLAIAASALMIGGAATFITAALVGKLGPFAMIRRYRFLLMAKRLKINSYRFQQTRLP